MAKTEKIGRIDCSNDVPLTQQNERDACDINIIMESVRRGVAPANLNDATPYFGSTIGVPSLREALQIVNEANASFAALDARIRDRFANDPVRLVEFLQDSGNFDEAVKLGLCLPKPPAEDVEPPAPVSSRSSKPGSSSKSTKAEPVGDDE